MSGPLEGLRVVDCSSGTAGPRATGLLADYGAEVIWVEPPGGDPCRERLAVEYSVFNRGKHSVVLERAGKAPLLDVLTGADVFVESWRPGVAESRGLGFEQLHSRFPALVVCSITGFGADGPHRDVPGYEALVHAIVGTMGEQFGHRDGPIFEALPFASIGAASLAVFGTLAALYRRSEDGTGRHVETTMLDGALVYLSMLWGDSDTTVVRELANSTDLNPAGATNRFICASFRCADETYIGVHTGAVGAFGRLMSVLGLQDQIPASESGRDMGVPLTPDEQKVLHGSIHEIFARDSREVWLERLLRADVCGVAVLEPGAVFDSPQARVNQMVVQVDDPVLGRVEQVAPPIRFAATPGGVEGPAPLVDGHREARHGHRGSRPWLGSQGTDDRPLLAGVKVLDLGAYYAGPCSSRHLADLGAEVIKLEPPAGDPMRGLPGLFRAAQAGKRAIALDLRAPRLRPAREQLLVWADIVHHNMRPGVAERLGVDYESTRALNPNVIYGYAPGWGSAGPFAQHQSFEPMMSGYVGVNYEVAGQFNPPLYPAGNADPGNALLGAIAMVMALLHRRRTGEGQYFENPQLNATMTHGAHVVRRQDGAVLGAGRLDPLQFGVGPLERLYETADGWLCLVAMKDSHLRGLTKVTGVDILDDERFATAQARAEHQYTLEALLAAALATRHSAELLAQLNEARVPAAVPRPYNNSAFMRDPENQRSGRVAVVPHPRDGHIRELDQYLRISDAQVPRHRLAPELGEHTDEILRQLGYDAPSIAELRAAGAVR